MVSSPTSLAATLELIHSYTAAHSAEQWAAAAADPGTRVLLASYNCPHRIGNNLHQFTNAFALALLERRWLLWSGDVNASCSKYLHRRGWLLTREQAKNGSKRATKNWSQVAIGSRELVWKPLVRTGATSAGSGAGSQPALSTSALSLCEWSRPATLANSSSNVMRFDPSRYANYQPIAALMAAVAHRWVGPAASRVATLSAFGTGAAYGALFHTLFTFENETVATPTARALCSRFSTGAAGLCERAREGSGGQRSLGRKQADEFWLAVHLRTYLDDAESALSDASFISATRRLLSDGLAGRNSCTVLLAGDEEPLAIRRVMLQVLQRAGFPQCGIVQSEHAATEVAADDAQQVATRDHGNLTEASAVRDVFLLSMADALVGMSRVPNGFSTFALLITELIAFRKVPLTAPVVMCACEPPTFDYNKCGVQGATSCTDRSRYCLQGTTCLDLRRESYLDKGKLLRWG